MRFKHFLFSSFIFSTLTLSSLGHAQPELQEEVFLDQNRQEFEQLLVKSDYLRFKKKKKKFVVENTWKPFFVKNDLIQPKKSYFFQSNLGVGFLRFSGVNGGVERSAVNPNPTSQNQIKGRLNYTRTPLFEAILGAQILNWLSLSFSYQHQGVIDVQSDLQTPRILTPTVFLRDQFQANLRLDALCLKVYLYSPKSMIWKTIAYTPYLAIGGGVDWQSWSNIRVNTFYLSGSAATVIDSEVFKNKYSPNAMYLFDLGLKMRSVLPSLQFSVVAGCKYNAWGQARSMGEKSQQDAGFYLNFPIHIKMVYQFAPYLGVQWNY